MIEILDPNRVKQDRRIFLENDYDSQRPWRAIQWTGENFSAFLDLDDAWHFDCRYVSLLRVWVNERWSECFVGEWVVWDSQGEKYLFGNTAFHKRFKERADKTTLRPSWEETYFSICHDLARRASCGRLHVGCVIVKEDRIILTGYNGSPKGRKHCIDVGCVIRDDHCVNVVHAESNCIYYAAKHGINTEGAICYVTATPCINCYNALKVAGITKIVYESDYRVDELVIEFAHNDGVLLEHYQ